MADDDLIGQLVHRWDQVVHKARGEQLALLVVVITFVQCGADALGDAAADMARQCHRIDERAAVVHGDIGEKPDLAGLDVDLDHRQMAHVSHDRIEDPRSLRSSAGKVVTGWS